MILQHSNIPTFYRQKSNLISRLVGTILAAMIMYYTAYIVDMYTLGTLTAIYQDNLTFICKENPEIKCLNNARIK